MNPTTLYLAGPMTGIPQFNFPTFDAAAEQLRAKGYVVLSPAEMDDEDTRAAALASPDGSPGSGSSNGETWGDFLARDLKIVADVADGIATLPGHEKSKGAAVECFVANVLHKPVSSVAEWLADADAIDADQERRVDYPAIPAEEMLAGNPDLRATTDAAEVIDKAALGPLPPEFPDSGEVRITSATGGQKGRKAERMDLIPMEPLWELARVYGMGAEKYDEHNYLHGYPWGLSYGALLRHVSQFINGEDLDNESGLNHLAHAAWHCFALMMFQWHNLGTDTRLSSADELGLTPQEITRTGRSEAHRKGDA